MKLATPVTTLTLTPQARSHDTNTLLLAAPNMSKGDSSDRSQDPKTKTLLTVGYELHAIRVRLARRGPGFRSSLALAPE